MTLRCPPDIASRTARSMATRGPRAAGGVHWSSASLIARSKSLSDSVGDSGLVGEACYGSSVRRVSVLGEREWRVWYEEVSAGSAPTDRYRTRLSDTTLRYRTAARTNETTEMIERTCINTT